MPGLLQREIRHVGTLNADLDFVTPYDGPWPVVIIELYGVLRIENSD